MLSDLTIHVGALYVSLYIPGPQSLKEKRMVLKRLKNDIRSRFNVSVGELGDQDKWQRATLGFSMIGADRSYIDGVLQKILNFLDDYFAVELCDHEVEFI